MPHLVTHSGRWPQCHTQPQRVLLRPWASTVGWASTVEEDIHAHAAIVCAQAFLVSQAPFIEEILAKLPHAIDTLQAAEPECDEPAAAYFTREFGPALWLAYCHLEWQMESAPGGGIPARHFEFLRQVTFYRLVLLWTRRVLTGKWARHCRFVCMACLSGPHYVGASSHCRRALQ